MMRSGASSIRLVPIRIVWSALPSSCAAGAVVICALADLEASASAANPPNARNIRLSSDIRLLARTNECRSPAKLPRPLNPVILSLFRETIFDDAQPRELLIIDPHFGTCLADLLESVVHPNSVCDKQTNSHCGSPPEPSFAMHVHGDGFVAFGQASRDAGQLLDRRRAMVRNGHMLPNEAELFQASGVSNGLLTQIYNVGNPGLAQARVLLRREGASDVKPFVHTVNTLGGERTYIARG